METIALKIDGMHCGACVRRVTSILGRIEGVKVDAVEIGSAKLSVAEAEPVRAEVAKAIEDGGFHLAQYSVEN